MEPASIRYKNPGAMWGKGNPIATKWGSTQTVYLNDGLNQGNNIAVFPTYVQGICAQMDLWRSSPKYRNKTFASAIAVWSGGNYVESYIKYVLARVPGMTRNTVMDDDFWRSPQAIGFLKAQAGHEAGKTYPAPDSDFIEAQKRVMSGVVPAAPLPPAVKKAAVVVGSAGSAGAAAHAAGASHTVVAIIVFAVVVIAAVSFIIHNRASS